jgi:diguanylate cyclase (GGDEF)-like protein/PAS domain S-box-containing protein
LILADYSVNSETGSRMFENLPPSLKTLFSGPQFLPLVEGLTGMAFWLYLPSLGLVFLSAQLGAHLGTDRPSLSEKAFASNFSKDSQQSLLNLFHNPSPPGEVWSELVSADFDGQKSVTCRLWAREGREGETRFLFGGIKDIQKEKAQGDYRKVLSQVVEYTSEAIVITDPEGKTVYVNQGFVDLTGYSMDEMLGCKPGKVLQGQDTNPETVGFISQRLQERRSFSCEILNYHKDGHPLWIRLAVHPRYNKRGELTHFMAIETDISGERMVQEALKEQKDQLHQEIEHRMRLEKELRHQALIDPLTGIANSRHFMQEFHKEIERAGRYSRPLSLVMFDIDFFKRVNDTFGHGTGDMVLKWVSNKTAKQLRSHDFMARIGGEEFIIMLPDTDLESAFPLAQRLRAGFSETVLPAGDSDLQITCSYGVAQWRLEEGAGQFLERVDQLLYKAKGLGRNMVIQV